MARSSNYARRLLTSLKAEAEKAAMGPEHCMALGHRHTGKIGVA